MIEAHGLTRDFGSRRAVTALDLELGPGTITGLLGVNGAGKTTVLRMLAGTLPPSAGTVRIAGHDLADAPLLARAALGWLPETPPLHPELSPRGQLRFTAGLHGQRPPDEAIDETLARTGILDRHDERIGALSRGYRQRIGLAAALVHGPKVLLLDEPLSGLDPAQRSAVRRLLRALADDGLTILLSSHVLTEVEQTCDRVVVLHEGRRVADRRTDGDTDGASLQLRVRRPEGLREALSDLQGVTQVITEGDTVHVRGTRDLREDVARLSVEHGLLELRLDTALDDLFDAGLR